MPSIPPLPNATIDFPRESTAFDSFGDFDKLSLELLHITFALLDFQSLARLLQTCLKGKEAVESMPEYRDTMRHASHSVAALGQTRLIKYHSAATIHTTLQLENCASCGAYGPFCLLPLFERCCQTCLRTNESLWVIPLALAATCFALPMYKVKCLPVMRRLPCPRRSGLHGRVLRLVSVRSAKQLAVEYHGSEKCIPREVRIHRDPAEEKEYRTFRWLHKAPLVPGPASTFRDDRPGDEYPGMASIAIPSVSAKAGVQHGLLCRGCRERPLTQEVGMSKVVRSNAALVDHVRQCPGIRQLIEETWPAAWPRLYGSMK